MCVKYIYILYFYLLANNFNDHPLCTYLINSLFTFK